MHIKLVITDDHPVVTRGLLNILKEFSHIEVVGVFASGGALLKEIAHLQPDVLLLDMHLGDMNGADLVAAITKKYPAVRILVLSSSDILLQVKKVLKLGCMGYLLKDSEDAVIIEAIETVYNGGQYISPSLQQLLVEDMFRNKANEKRSLTITRREKEILQLIIQELTNQEIADKLFISLHTVENHRISLLHKLNVKNTAGLVKVALQTGLA
jgi:DNA-binding NarL/FixJ family response regulator